MKRVTGISLMLLIFLSLCLITFSLLSLSGAAADARLSRMAADRTTEYYQAETKAQEILGAIDASLASCLKEAEQTRNPEGEYLALCASVPASVSDTVWSDGLISFSVAINEQQILQAALEPVYPLSGEDTLYRITAWKVVNTSDWNADTRQKVYTRDH